MTAEIVVVNFYALRDATAFDRAVMSLVARVRLSGHPGVKSYRFFGSGPKERRAVVVYQNPEAWVGHHDLIMAWSEVVALRAAARLARVDLYGPISAEMHGWIDKMGLAKQIRHQGEPISGFVR